MFSRGVADYVNGTTIDETKVNQEMDEIATALTNSIAADGQTNPSANLKMNSKKFTGLAVGTARTDSASIANIADGGHLWGGTGGGTADVITITLSPVITAYAAGQKYAFITSGVNTTNVTLNIDSVGAKAVTKNGTTALVAGDMPSGAIVLVQYDGTQFQLLNLGGTGDFTLLDVDNITFNGNDISSTNTNGDITLSPNGTGKVKTDNLSLDGNTLASTDTDGDVNITPDGTGDVVLDGQKWPQADGAANTVLKTDGAAQDSWVLLQTLLEATWTNTGSIDLTSGSPTSVSLASSLVNVSEIEIHIEGFSTNLANQAPMIQIGDSGGLETASYSGTGNTINSNATASSGNSAGFLLSDETLFDAATVGDFKITLAHLGSNIWEIHSEGNMDTSGGTFHIAKGLGLKTLTGVLDRVSITTSGGSATFDGGTAHVRTR